MSKASKVAKRRRTADERNQAKRARVIVSQMQRGTFEEERKSFFNRLSSTWRDR